MQRQVFVGIDVSKVQLEVALSTGEGFASSMIKVENQYSISRTASVHFETRLSKCQFSGRHGINVSLTWRGGAIQP